VCNRISNRALHQILCRGSRGKYKKKQVKEVWFHNKHKQEVFSLKNFA